MKTLSVPHSSFVLLLVIVAGCDRGEGDPSKKTATSHNLLLITLDTLRADHLGCYGYKEAKTPALDSLAARGMVFEDAQSQVPLTLPSHCSIMTGRFPREFGVRNNNQKALGTTHPTLASIFKQHGYQTAAFVASFVLDGRFGLNRGFDHYDDHMGNVSMDVQPLDWEQPANVIADRTIAWLETNKNRPFFCWAHFFDPHDPHRPPQPFPQSYDGEIAYMDTQIKRISDWLDESGLKDSTFVVIVGDHGESFGEHGEIGHGMFLYQTTLHVPMIVVHPRLVSAGKRVVGPVGNVDIFPTVLDLFDWPSPDGFLSKSFASTLTTGVLEPREVFSESDYAYYAYNWAEQRSLTTDRWKYISSTRPELFDRKDDPAESKNLLTEKRDVAAEFAAKLYDLYQAMQPNAGANVQPSAKALEALSGLGYVDVRSEAEDSFLTPGLGDPKEKMQVVEKYKEARKLMAKEHFKEALPLLESAVAEAPDALALQGTLGSCLVRVEKYQEALEPLEEALKLDPTFQPALMGMGDAQMGLGNLENALAQYKAAAENDPFDPSAQVKIALVLSKTNRRAEGEPYLRKAIEIFPEFPEAHYELGVILADRQDYAGAIKHYQVAVRLKPEDELSHYNLGVALFNTNRLTEAVDCFRQATALDPEHGDAWINLGVCLLKLESTEEGKASLLRATGIEESAADAYFNLATAASKEDDSEGAAAFLEKVIERRPGHSPSVLGLAAIHLKEHQTKDAVRVLRSGIRRNESDLQMQNLLAWILSTSSDAGTRNGTEALRMATSVSEKTRFQNPSFMQTLAAAYAETGDFDKAVSTGRQALALIPEGDGGVLKEALAGQLENYRARRPTRSDRF